ncbi:MAG: hypothetical protein LBP19_03885 [Treponema sp.]|jgi:hypothetical protein|nr:hypothetical protein [Treponema sp.]
MLFSGYDEYVSAAVLIVIGFLMYGVPSIILLALLYVTLFGRIGILRRAWRLLHGGAIKNKQ